MISNVHHQDLIGFPIQAIEELLKSSRRLHILVVARQRVQLVDEEVKSSLLLGQDAVYLGFNLTPGNTMQAPEGIEGRPLCPCSEVPASYGEAGFIGAMSSR